MNKELIKWGKNKPSLVVAMSQLAVLVADDAQELITLISSEDVRLPGPRPNECSEWLKLYGSHRRLRQGVLSALGMREQRISEIEMTLVDFLNWCSRADSQLVSKVFQNIPQYKRPRIFRHACKLNSWMLQKHYEEMSSTGAGGFFTEADGSRALASLPFRFFLKVAFPCWLSFGKWPSKMLYESTRRKKNNWPALEKLIGLDKSITHHPRIKWMISNSPRHTRQRAREAISKGIKARPKCFTRKAVKYRISRLLSRMSDRMGYRLLEPDIRELFNIVSRSKHGGQIDTDLPTGSEAFAKAIQREPQFWDLPPKPDKEILKRVRALREHLA